MAVVNLLDHKAVADARQRELLAAELAIVVPTYNESANVPLLVAAIGEALPGVRWELLFVDDDSPDGTADRVREIAQTDPRVRVVHRFGRRGLSSACVEGIMATAAPFVAVMDADLQHDERILPDMLARMRGGAVDLVIGSRYTDGGGIGEWSAGRAKASRLATRLAGRLTRSAIHDPMSGFFMIRRDAFLRALPNLSSLGFKILLDIVASTPEPLRVAEVPFIFRSRRHGESKLDALVVWEYAQLIIDKAVGRWIPARFLSFAMVGGLGLLVHFMILSIMFVGLGVDFALSQGVATAVAITNNFLLNNALTYRDQRLRGQRLLAGWITFNLVCAVGAAANIGVAEWLFGRHTNWIVSAIAGVLVSVVWNYAMSALFTWRKR